MEDIMSFIGMGGSLDIAGGGSILNAREDWLV